MKKPTVFELGILASIIIVMAIGQYAQATNTQHTIDELYDQIQIVKCYEAHKNSRGYNYDFWGGRPNTASYYEDLVKVCGK